MNKKTGFLLCLALLAGCQQLATIPAEEEAATETAAQPAEQSAPVSNFSSDAMYDLLVAELAGQRGQPRLALDRYNRQVRRSGNQQIAERAYRIAEYLEDRPSALRNAIAWVRLAPEQADAHRAAAAELARNGRFAPALEHARQAMLLEPEGDSGFDLIAFIAAHADPGTRQELAGTLDELLLQQPQRHELQLAKAILLQESDPQQALQLLENIPTRDAGIPVLVMLSRLYQQLEQPAKSLAAQQAIMQRQPDNNHVRLTYARQLIGLNRLEEARDEFLVLLQNEADNDDFRLGLAYLYMDLEAWREAMVYLHELLERDSYTDTARYNLGRCLEALEQPQAAMTVYREIGPGQFFLAARQQLGLLLLPDQPQEFERQFSEARQLAPDEAQTLLQVEIEILVRDRQYDRAWQQVQQALQEFPGDHGLLYTRALLAEKRDDLPQLERDLRSILAEDPEHAMALNALGYTLTDRTDRHAEALQLIRKANQLQPDDAATMDSLGWVHYHLGQYQEALNWLQQAYDAYPDPEVAAHLGEVLWMLGQKRQARKVWREALGREPEHEILLETLKRLDNRKEWFK